MSTFEQLVRIGLNAAGCYFLGDAVAQGALYQGAVGGVISIISFGWWMYANRKKA